MNFPYIVNENHITLYVDRVMYNLPNSDEALEKFFSLYRKEDTPENKKNLISLFSLLSLIREKLGEHFEVKDNKVFLAGSNVSIPSILATRIQEATIKGYPISMLKNFWAKCLQNPSEESRQSLYDFLTTYAIPIHENGDIIIYKAVYKKVIDKGAGIVEQYYTDIHTETFKIYLGQEVRMVRGNVNSDRNVSCAAGLHVGSFEYARRFGGDSNILLACYVNPKDVVAVPNHECSKMRVCAYTPFELVDEEFTKTYLGQVEMEMTGLNSNCDDDINYDHIDWNDEDDEEIDDSDEKRILQEEIDYHQSKIDELQNKIDDTEY